MKTILLVDDEPEVLKCLSEMLQRLNYRVLTSRNGPSALALMGGTGNPDLVITDQRMPGMDGLEFICLLRQKLPDVPIIMMTAYGTMESYLTAGTLGVFRYLQKPIRLRDLERTAADALCGLRQIKKDACDAQSEDQISERSGGATWGISSAR